MIYRLLDNLIVDLKDLSKLTRMWGHVTPHSTVEIKGHQAKCNDDIVWNSFGR